MFHLHCDLGYKYVNLFINIVKIIKKVQIDWFCYTFGEMRQETNEHFPSIQQELK